MKYIERGIEGPLGAELERGKSVLLLGPRQTGKSTMLSRRDAALAVNLIDPEKRLAYEKSPSLLREEVAALARGRGSAAAH